VARAAEARRVRCGDRIDADRPGRLSQISLTEDMMTNPYRLISEKEFAAFGDVIRRQGFAPGDFELQEDVFDPATAEVETALGEVGVRCLTTQAGAAYPVGAGRAWLASFESDLKDGRLGGRNRT
jgi:hypothetical protein